MTVGNQQGWAVAFRLPRLVEPKVDPRPAPCLPPLCQSVDCPRTDVVRNTIGRTRALPIRAVGVPNVCQPQNRTPARGGRRDLSLYR